MKVVKTVNPRSSHHKEKYFFLFFHLCEMINVHETCGNHFMIYGSQIIMLYTLNLYSAVYQLCLNKTARKYLKNNYLKLKKRILKRELKIRQTHI